MSTDARETSERFRRELDLPFPLVADETGAIARAYGVRWPLVGWARRATFVIGGDGKVLVAYHSEMAVDEHAARASAALAGSA